MAYEYYCMHCGRQLNQDIVLFDLQHLLTRSKEQKFALLKFRMTVQEFKDMLQKGTPEEAGYRKCSLTFPEIMQIISNENNLNNKDIAELTVEDIQSYIEHLNTAFGTTKKVEKSAFDLFSMDDEEEEEEEQKIEYTPSAAIHALEATDENVDDRAFTANKLKPDLTALQSLFFQNDTLTFSIREEMEADNEGNPVLVGCDIHIPLGNVHMSFEFRVCNKCGAPVFSHAGTAKHQAISFVGYQKAGKTSTILALTHYAMNNMMVDLGEYGDDSTKIWKGCSTIPSVASVELLDKNDNLAKDLADYALGIAPDKTSVNTRTDAYCATFRIKNKLESKYYLITLTDLPGELCLPDGTVDKEKVLSDFQVALSCDAFVACFDTQSINPNGEGVTSWILNVCKWADEFQKLRAKHNQVETYVPTMLLYTKCRDLEQPQPEIPITQLLLPIKRTYSLWKEKLLIDKNPLYGFVSEQFNEMEHLSKAYHAMLRSSPFGYAAPGKAIVSQNPDINYQPPMPKNIDVLMRWLLSVAGCIPTEGEYRRDAMGPNALRLDKFCIGRPQLRSENPVKEQDLNESLARCILFENPGYFDEKILVKYDTPWQLVVARFESKLRSGTNAR